MSRLIDIIRREAAMLLGARQSKGTLVATSYDAENHAVKGIIVPHMVESGWVRLGAIHVGNGYGILVGPKVGDPKKLDGDQFDIVHENGDPNMPMAMHRGFSVKAKPPKVESGEMLLKHEDGGSLFFAKDKSVTVTHANGGYHAHDKDGNFVVNTANKNVTVDAGEGTATHKAKAHTYEGDMTVTGNISATGKVDGAGGVSQNGMALT